MTDKVKIPFTFTSKEAKEIYDGKPPQYGSERASGFDLRCVDIDFDHCYPLPPDNKKKELDRAKQGWLEDSGIFLGDGVRSLVKTGIRVALPTLKVRTQGSFFSMLGFDIRTNDEQKQDFSHFPMELQIRSRADLALKHGVHVLNSPGTIDNDYTDEICVILQNNGLFDEPARWSSRITTEEFFDIKKGMPIAQGVLNPLMQAEFKELSEEEFGELATDRGSDGFGSTGIE